MKRLFRPLYSVIRQKPPSSTSNPARMIATAAGAGEEEKAGTIAVQKQTDPGSQRDMRRAFYIDAVVDKVMNRSLGHPFLMWIRTRAEWYRLLRSRRGCRLFLDRSKFLQQLRSSIREEELDSMRRFGAEKLCLARSFSEHSRIKMDLYRYKFLSLAKEDTDSRPRSPPPLEDVGDEVSERNAVAKEAGESPS